MIRIIKHGKIPLYFATCSNCGCEIECEQEDLSTDYSNIEMRYYVYCPDCGEKTYITKGINGANLIL